ncbi:MAG: hypothetical protein RI900_1729, partial [Actinomycetota bacterium]
GLQAEGHEVLSCRDERGGPCRGVARHHDCPLEHHVDMAIVAREPGSAHTLHEMGGVCAQGHRVPLVEVNPFDLADGLPSVAVASALATRRVEEGYSAAVRAAITSLPAMVDVRREADRIHATIQIPAGAADRPAMTYAADRARAAIREHDPFVSCIDVSVVTYPDAVS